MGYFPLSQPLYHKPTNIFKDTDTNITSLSSKLVLLILNYILNIKQLNKNNPH